MPLLTLNKLSELCGMDRRAITPLLDAVPFQPGPNNSHLYDSGAALAAIYRCRHGDGDPKSSLAEAKIRNELAAAKLREISAKEKLEELVPAEMARLAINTFIKHIAQRFDELRRRGVIDEKWIDGCRSSWIAICADLAEQHGIEFCKTIVKRDDVAEFQALIDRFTKVDPSSLVTGP
jgi:hypothetical protein